MLIIENKFPVGYNSIQIYKMANILSFYLQNLIIKEMM